MSTTPNLALTNLDPGQNQKEVTINGNMSILDTRLGAFVAANTGKLVGVDASGNAIPIAAGVLSISGAALAFANQSANMVLAGPASGAAAAPGWRALTQADVPRAPTVQALTDPGSGAIATDASLGNHVRVTLTGNRTLSNPTNPTDGQRMVWELVQDGTGSRTITLDTKFALGTDISSITLTTTASKRDFLGAIYNATADKWYVVAFAKGY